MSERSLTVIVPALNEQSNLIPTLDKIAQTVPKYFSNWEILIFNDGSRDRTGEVADQYAATHANVRVFHHQRPISLGGVFRRGHELSQYDELIVIHGQNAITVEAMDRIFTPKDYDLVIPYQTNALERPVYRYALSLTFTVILNAVFNLNLKYFNHYVLFKKELLKNLKPRTSGYAYQAELLIKILKSKSYRYLEVPVRDDFSTKKKTSAFRIKNIISVVRFFFETFWDVYFLPSIIKASATPSATHPSSD